MELYPAAGSRSQLEDGLKQEIMSQTWKAINNAPDVPSLLRILVAISDANRK